MSEHTIQIICGPTASGKSARALFEAERTGRSCIINADSMQIYDALPTLTAQPSEDEKHAVPHHLYALLHPSESCSAAHWCEMATGEIHQAIEQGLDPLIVGGTGFYIAALVYGLSPIPDVPDTVRNEITAMMAAMGNESFYKRLEKDDPAMAKRLHPQDTQRLIRAFEVLRFTGKSLSYWQEQPREKPLPDTAFHITFVCPERNKLIERCNARFENMLENGALEEVAALKEQIERGEVPADAAITHALGFDILSKLLDKDISRKDAKERVKIETRQYAKRQKTWFRHQLKTVSGSSSVTIEQVEN